MQHSSRTWSDARLAKLQELDGRGFSATEIASALSLIDAECGPVTRNAVMGKLWRMQGKKSHAATTNPAWKTRPQPGPAPHRPRQGMPKQGRRPRYAKHSGLSAELIQAAAASPAPSPETVVPFGKLDRQQCRWVLNDPKSVEGAQACGAKAMAATYDGAKRLPPLAHTYCQHHVFLSLGDEARRRAGIKEH